MAGFVTGSSRGIGQYIARSLTGAGYNVVLTGRSGAELQKLAGDLNSSQACARAVAADITDPVGQDEVIGAAEREFGRVDVLVNNAGGDPQREFEAMTWAENEAIVRLNLLAPMQLTLKLLPGMIRRGRGHIVNISAIAGRVGFPYLEAYAAAKDGLIGFTPVLRNDYRGRGVSASAAILGAVRGAGQGQRTSDESKSNASAGGAAAELQTASTSSRVNLQALALMFLNLSAQVGDISLGRRRRPLRIAG